MTLSIPTARVFEPLLTPKHRYYAAHGGRGSAKSWFFAGRLVERALLQPGLRAVCCREIQKSLAESAKRTIEDMIARFGVGSHFGIYHDKIITPGGGAISFWGLADKQAESIKSLEGADICWIEEAQNLSGRSLQLLRPTIRKDGSQIWASWNPRKKTDAVDVFLRQQKPANAIVVELNWRDNPFWPDVLEEERQLDFNRDPHEYMHVWEGAYATAIKGSYFGKLIQIPRQEGRITDTLAVDPLPEIKAYWDLGVGDATAIWIAQYVGAAIHVIDFIEASGQPLSFYVNELRSRGYENAQCVLPHDGVSRNNVTGHRFEDHLRDANFRTQIIENQGMGAAKMRIEAARRILPRCWFHAKNCEAGLEALAWYHERKDDHRDVGLGPLHDWSKSCSRRFWFAGDSL